MRDILFAGLQAAAAGDPKLADVADLKGDAALARLRWLDDGAAAALGAAASLNVVALGPDDMAARLWRKLAANCVLNPLTALHRCDNGAVLRDPGRRDVAARVLAEVAAVARADGWPGATAGDLAAAVDACAAENAANFSSMYQDCKRGRRTEVDHLGAWVAARGAALGVDAPENARLAADVRALEPWGD